MVKLRDSDRHTRPVAPDLLRAAVGKSARDTLRNTDATRVYPPHSDIAARMSLTPEVEPDPFPPPSRSPSVNAFYFESYESHTHIPVADPIDSDAADLGFSEPPTLKNHSVRGPMRKMLLEERLLSLQMECRDALDAAELAAVLVLIHAKDPPSNLRATVRYNGEEWLTWFADALFNVTREFRSPTCDFIAVFGAYTYLCECKGRLAGFFPEEFERHLRTVGHLLVNGLTASRVFEYEIHVDA